MFSSFSARAVGLAHLPVEVTIDIAAEAGFDAVDLMIRDLVRSRTNLGPVRDRLAAQGLRAGAFPMSMDWRGNHTDFRRDLAELRKLAEAAASLGLSRTGTWVMPETPQMPQPGADPMILKAEVTAFHLDRLGAIARVLAEHNIRLGLEVIGVTTFRRGIGIPFITRMSDLGPNLGAIFQEPNVGLLVDAFHLHAAAESFEAALSWGPERIVWAHIADLPPSYQGSRTEIIDAERGLPGANGAVDCQAFLAFLNNAGFDGPVTVEPLAQCNALMNQQPIEVARRVKAALDACWPWKRRLLP